MISAPAETLEAAREKLTRSSTFAGRYQIIEELGKGGMDKVYETDTPLCPSCGGQMWIISFIENPKVIDKIILHLKFTFEAERSPPLQVAQQKLLMTAEERGEYF